jgi:hypothetical protein
MHNIIKQAVGILVAGLAMGAQAATITDGFTYSVASSSGSTDSGSHFHSNTGGAFGNPAGKAEVGRFFSEEVRGLSEYNLTGLAAASSAYVTFDVYKAAGLFGGSNDFPFEGRIEVDAYRGNNAENISDYQAASTGLVGSFATTPLFVGGVVSFNVTSIFNAAIANGDSSLGIRLKAAPLNPSGAWTFQSFRLTSDNQGTIPAVPEPESLALMAAGVLTVCTLARRKKAQG